MGSNLAFFDRRFWEPGEIPRLFNSRNFGVELLNEIMLSKLMKCCLSEGGTWRRFGAGSRNQQSPSAAKLFEKKGFFSFIPAKLRSQPTPGARGGWGTEREGGCGPTLLLSCLSPSWCPSWASLWLGYKAAIRISLIFVCLVGWFVGLFLVFFF